MVRAPLLLRSFVLCDLTCSAVVLKHGTYVSAPCVARTGSQAKVAEQQQARAARSGGSKAGQRDTRLHRFERWLGPLEAGV